VVNRTAGSESSVDDVAHEQVHDAGPRANIAEQLLGPRQRPGVTVDVYRQAGGRRHQLADRYPGPAEQRVLHDHSAVAVDPAATGHTEAERDPAIGVLVEKTRDPAGHPEQDVQRFRPGVGQPLLGENAAAHVQQRESCLPHGDVQPARHPAADVDLDRNVRAAHPFRAAGFRYLAQQAAGVKFSRQPAHGRGAEPGEPGDRAAGHRAVVQGCQQHSTGIGGPAAILRLPDVLSPQRRHSSRGDRVREHVGLLRAAGA
jgi:hypothetical protein